MPKKCEHCDGPLGLVCHSYYSLRFCTLAHKKAYLHNRDERLKAKQQEYRVFQFLQWLNAKLP